MRGIICLVWIVLLVPAGALGREPIDRPAHDMAAAHGAEGPPSRDLGEPPAKERQENERPDIGDNPAATTSDDSTGDERPGEVEAPSEHSTPDPGAQRLDREGRAYRAGEMVVVAEAGDVARLGKLGVAVVGQTPLPALGAVLVRIAVPLSSDADRARDRIARAAPRDSVDLNHLYRVSGGAAEGFARDASARHIDALAGKVGIIDTTVEERSGGLAGALLASRSFAAGRASDSPHGTQVAYVAARLGARLLAANVFTADPKGGESASVDAIALAVEWLLERSVPVINLSLEGPPNRALADILRRAGARGCLLVAAAGNSGPAAPPAYPAAYPWVVAVTAVDQQGRIYVHANRGAYIMFAARGVGVPVPHDANTETQVSGTSFAAPIVSVLLARRLPRPDARAAPAAVQALARNARHLGPPGRNEIFGYGEVGDQIASR
jgi:hypothetical protein